MFGLPGSASAGAPPLLSGPPGFRPVGPPPLPGMNIGPPPPEEFEPLLVEPVFRSVDPGPLLEVLHPNAAAPRAPANTARPRYFRIVNTPNQQRPESRMDLALAAAESRNEPRRSGLVNEKSAFPE